MTKEELKLVVDVVFAWVESREAGSPIALALTKVVHASIVANLDVILSLVRQKQAQP